MLNNIIGNEKAKEILNKIVENKNFVNSYLFVGIEGIGKFLYAKEFAKKILNVDDLTKSMDYYEINFGKDSIKVDEVRKIEESIYTKPVISDKKVIIINNSENMTVAAQNAFLKTLEEPPSYAIIILITSNETLLLTTIKSRCMKIKFEKINDEQIEKYIKENLDFDPTDNMIKSCEGSIGYSRKIVSLQEDYLQIEKFAKDIKKKSLLDAFKSGQIFYDLKPKAKKTTKKKEDDEGYEKTIFDYLDYLNIVLYNSKDADLINCVDIVEKVKKNLKLNANYDMSIDYLIMKMWEEIN